MEDCPSLSWQGFDNRVSAVGVHTGPDYMSWKAAHPGQEPRVALYEHHNYGGRFLVLTAGGYADLSTTWGPNINDRVSSVKFDPVAPVFESSLQIPYGDSQVPHGIILIPVEPIGGTRHPHPFAEMPLVIDVYKHPNFVTDYLTIVEDCENVSAHFGSDFNDAITSVRVREGSGWNRQWVELYPHPNFEGKPLPLGLGSYPHLQNVGYNDTVSSIRIVR